MRISICYTILAGRTNKPAEVIDREYEHALIGLPPAPCIKGWSHEQIFAEAKRSGGFLFAVEVPRIVAETLADPAMDYPISKAAAAKLEALVADHNCVSPEKICADETILQRGHQWQFFPETARILTGFDYLI